MKRLLVLSFLMLVSCGLPSQMKATPTPSPTPLAVPVCVEIAAKTLTSGKVVEGFYACNAPGELRDSLTQVGVTDDATMAKWMEKRFPWTRYTICGSDGDLWYIDLEENSNHLALRITLDANRQISELGVKPNTEPTNTCERAPIKKTLVS